MMQFLSLLGHPWTDRNEGQFTFRGVNVPHRQTEQESTVCLSAPPQGDPGGVIGIVPLKGDKGFSGTPGFPVRLVHLRVNIHACRPKANLKHLIL